MDTMIFRENTTSFGEQEVITHLLQFAPNKGNKAAQAAALLETFGSVKNILEARPEQLANVPEITARTAEYISAFLPTFKYYQHQLNDHPTQILNTRQAETFCKSLIYGERIENFYLIALSAKCNVIGKRRIATGSLSEVDAYPRLIVEAALNFNAHSVILTHNHPGGTCAPSMQDIQSTITIKKLLNQLSIMILDHIIIAGDNTYSMIQHGDIDYR